MNMPENNSVDTRTYFEDIGAWPARAGSHVRAYVLGFVFSIILTLAAYALTSPAGNVSHVYVWLLVLALLQFAAQLFYFLHLGGKSTRERLYALLCGGIVVCILMIGSLWVMTSLNARMMQNSTQMLQYMNDQNGGI